ANALFVYTNSPEADLRNQPPSSPAVKIVNCHRFVGRIIQFLRRQQGRQMIARWNVEFARADKNSSAVFHGPIPILVLARVGRRQECDGLSSKGSKQLSCFWRCRDAAICLLYDFGESREPRRIA